jgi:hypothetical protein
VITRPAALVLAVALAAPAAGAGDGSVSAQATLHGRFTALENVPGQDVLYDRASGTFQLSHYLVPSEDDRYGSAYASFALDGHSLGGDLHWRFAIDTGELRRRSFPLVAPVCFSDGGTGLAILGSGNCRLPLVVVPLQEARLDGSRITSNGRRLEDEIDATLLIREAYAAYSFGRAGFATVRVGRKRVSVADGFVYDDYASGAELALDVGAIGPPLAVTVSVFQPTRDWPRSVRGISPFLAVRADWLPSLFEHAGIFVAAHRDRTGSVAELFRGALVERLAAYLAQASSSTDYIAANHRLAGVLGARLESDATMAWVGTSGRIVPWRGQRIGWTAGLLRGSIDHVTTANPDLPPIAEDVKLDGRLFQASWDGDLGDRIGLGAFFLHVSGGTFPVGPPTQSVNGSYGGFLGIAPFITATNLFFGGGLSESFAARQSTAPGVNGRGVDAPGLSVSFDPTDAVGLGLKAAYLTAPVKGPSGGRVYGTEVDASLSWSPRDGIVVGAELDVLWPGDFYAGGRTVYKTIVALDLVTP